jgi:transaldolase
MFENLNFSLWCDFIERDFLDRGFSDLLNRKIINGATSNPAIFQGAFKNSDAYKEQITSLKDRQSKEIYEELASFDIKKCAQILKPLYDENKDNGYISIEVDPLLCDDADGTYSEAMRLYEKIDMPNVMIKIPATDSSYDAMKRLIENDVSVNATLIFSPTQASSCIEAFSSISSGTRAVISVFVSRFDRKLDEILPEKGKAGIYNATKIYKLIEESNLPEVRTLFASTGVKGDIYPKDYYIRELLYPYSINTAPIETIEAFVNGGDFQSKYPIENYEIDRFFNEVKKTIDIKLVYSALLSEGLLSFKDSFSDILNSF